MTASRARLAGALLAAAGGVLLAACGSTPSSTGQAGASGGGSTTPGTGSTASSSTSSTTPPTTSTVPPLPRGSQGDDAAIPWNEVGPGWTLALWSDDTSSPPKGDATLFLVDPAGGRYLVTAAVPAGESLTAWGTAPGAEVAFLTGVTTGDNSTPITGIDLENGSVLYQRNLTGAMYSVAGVSGDGERVLLTGSVVNTTSTAVEELDLESGSPAGAFSVGSYAMVGYTLPQGTDLVVSAGGQLRRVAPDGTTQLTFPSTFSSVGSYYTGGPFQGSDPFLYAADGSSLVVAASRGLAVVSNAGPVEKQLPVTAAGGADQSCTPVQWWSANVVLALCTSAPQYADSFWEVPLSGATPTLLAQDPGILGQLWKVGNGIYGQFVACGTQSVDVLGTNGSFSTIPVPGLTQSEHIVGATSTRLEVLGEAGCDVGPGAKQTASFALVWFDPSSDSTTVLLGPSVNGGTVLGALAYQRG